MRTRPTRGRVAAVTTSVAALAVTTVMTAAGGGLASPAAAAPEGCEQPFDIADLTEDQEVNGLTVTRGTDPSPFTGTYLGTLRDGIAPGVDMVLARLSSSEIDRPGVGIWAGMSGSPVYTADGDLIGAVAYSLSFGPSTVAGITPYSEMDKYLGSDGAAPTAARKVDVDAATAREIAADSEVSARQASQGLRQLPLPLGVSGVAPARLAKLADTGKGRAWVNRDAVAAGSGRGLDPIPSSALKAGGNVAASISYGDVNAAGVGTVTAVCNDQVVGFGHPFSFSGETTLSLHPAAALYIQDDPVFGAFKVANLGDPVGEVTDDHLTAITGTIGTLPETTTVASTVTFEEGVQDARTGETKVSLPVETPWITLLQILTNHDVVLDGYFGGSESQAWQVTGTDPDGKRFVLDYADQYRSRGDIAWASAWDVAELAWTLTNIEGVTIDTIGVTSDVTTNLDQLKVVGLQQRRGGSWTKVTRQRPAVGRAGRSVRLRAVLERADGSTSTSRPRRIALSSRMRNGYGELTARGGNTLWSSVNGSTVEDVRDNLASRVRNDQVLYQVAVYKRRAIRARATGPQQRLVVGGRLNARILVR